MEDGTLWEMFWEWFIDDKGWWFIPLFIVFCVFLHIMTEIL